MKRLNATNKNMGMTKCSKQNESYHTLSTFPCSFLGCLQSLQCKGNTCNCAFLLESAPKYLILIVIIFQFLIVTYVCASTTTFFNPLNIEQTNFLIKLHYIKVRLICCVILYRRHYGNVTF